MISLRTSVRLRPTRIGFLVSPSDQDSVRRIMRLCTCLWGGVYNPIIPVTQRLPSAWRNSRNITGLALSKNVLDFFEPDVFVEAKPGLAERLGIEYRQVGDGKSAVMGLEDFVRPAEGAWTDFGFGLNIIDLYRDLYRDEFRFAPRYDRRVGLPTAAKGEAAFVEAVFGAFPESPGLSYFKEAFIEFSDPVEITINSDTFPEIINDPYLFPLNFTRHGLDVSGDSNAEPSSFFVFDSNSTTDLIDLWNLRQFHRGVVPVNVSWCDKLAEFLRSFIHDRYVRVRPESRRYYTATKLEFARSIGEAKKKHLHELFRDLPDGSWSPVRHSEPNFYAERYERAFQPRRLHVTADERDVETIYSEKETPTIRFTALSPDFAESHSGIAARWVNVVSFNNVSGLDVATTVPRRSLDLRRWRIGGGMFVSREGFVLPARFKGWEETIHLTNGSDAIAPWLEAKGIRASKSDPGRIADELLASIGGLWGTYILEDAETLRLLDKMAKTKRLEDSGAVSEYPSRTATVREWSELIRRRQANQKYKRLELQDYIEAGALRLGLSLKCEICTFANWYSVSDLTDRPKCDRCLKKYSFPQATLNFGNTPWRYRITGPFAVPDYAAGAYSAILALATFTRKLSYSSVSTTFSTNLDLKTDTDNLEIDFALWYSRDEIGGQIEEPSFIVGEAKSFAKEAIRVGDVQKLKRLAILIPGTFLVFAVLKKQLSTQEVEMLRKLAVWGRKRLKDGRRRAPVIILTGTELFAETDIYTAWDEANGLAATIAEESLNHRGDDLRVLADLTQQIYLGLDPSYSVSARPISIGA